MSELESEIFRKSRIPLIGHISRKVFNGRNLIPYVGRSWWRNKINTTFGIREVVRWN